MEEENGGLVHAMLHNGPLKQVSMFPKDMQFKFEEALSLSPPFSSLTLNDCTLLPTPQQHADVVSNVSMVVASASDAVKAAGPTVVLLAHGGVVGVMIVDTDQAAKLSLGLDFLQVSTLQASTPPPCFPSSVCWSHLQPNSSSRISQQLVFSFLHPAVAVAGTQGHVAADIISELDTLVDDQAATIVLNGGALNNPSQVMTQTNSLDSEGDNFMLCSSTLHHISNLSLTFILIKNTMIFFFFLFLYLFLVIILHSIHFLLFFFLNLLFLRAFVQ